MTRRQTILLALLLLLLLGVAWLGWSGWRAASQTRLALADLRRIQAAAADPKLAALPALRGDLAALDLHLTAAHRAARPFLFVAPALRSLPRYGDSIAAAPALLALASEVAGAGRQAADALAPAIDALAAGGTDALPQVVATLESAQPELAAATVHLDHAAVLRAEITGSLHPRLATLLEQLDKLLPLAQAGLQVAEVAPDLLGAQEPRAYLILAQNSHELRPTGGFISGAGIIRFDKGEITELKLTDSYSVDNWDQPHPPAPRPLTEQMGSQLLLLRDSNWSPDFPQTGDVARALYAQDQGAMTDGTVALDLEAVRLLVGALGPLQVPGIAEPVTGDNAIDWMKRAWAAPTSTDQTVGDTRNPEWWSKRKDFMGELVGAALQKLKGGGDLNLAALGRATLQMLDARHLQVAVDDPTVAKLMAERGWDGALRPPAGSDFLAVVDANVGFNKANAAVRPAFDYRVAPDENGTLTATLTITETHTAPLGVEKVCDRTPRYGETYDEMVQRCYWSYLRIYVPGGSELVEVAGLKDPITEEGERATTVFAGHFSLPPAQQHVVSLRYRLPPEVPSGPYRLFVRKEAGTDATPLHVEALSCQWDTDLSRDRTFVCPE